MGMLVKMRAGFDPARPVEEGAVRYALRFGTHELDMTPLVGRPFALRFTGQMTCVSCGRGVKKFFGQGFCYPCFRDAPEAAECIVRPELCRAHLGEGRDPQWEREHHDTEHVVYLSFTGGIKVGVTRATQVPVRWIDQGAVAAVRIARTPYRQLAGAIEVALKAQFDDRTNWRAMLKPVRPDIDALLAARDKALSLLPEELQAHALPAEAPQLLHYPHDVLPPKVASINLEKEPEVAGTLAGIKGQYLVWADGRVLNVRNHSGFHIAVEDV
ncbi:MAG: DUF2797 domain-containing protein [Flavobacteriales bacterium]|nr:DUF2797 domain-containing protein [Flavobacteriales bacterium]